MIGTLFSLLPLLGAAAIVVLAQTQVKERSNQAALALTIGGGLEAGFLLLRQFVHHELLWLAGPLVSVGAAGAVAFGLLTLVDELNPKRAQPLPHALATHAPPAPNIVPQVMFGIFGVLGMLGTGMRNSLPLTVSEIVALAAALAGSVWVVRRGDPAKWVFERRPDLVTWAYVHQLRIVNRNTGSSSTHWSAQVGLATGEKVALAASSEQIAQVLVASVMELTPGVAAGFTAENAARFKASPGAMRG